MQSIVLVVHVLIATALVGVILLQRSEGGIGLGGGTMGGLMSGRGSANLMTRATGMLAGGFIATSLILAILAGHSGAPTSILDLPATPPPAGSAPATPAVPATPAAPAAPVAQ